MNNKKIAVLLTGQLRTCDMLKYLHINTLISKYDADLFLSINLNNEYQNQNLNSHKKSEESHAKEIIDFFNPIDYVIHYDFSDELNKLQYNTQINLMKYQLILQQYWIVKNAYNLLINHIHKTNQQCDFIIRLRFDQFIWTDTTNIFDKLIMENNNIIYNKENIELIDKHSKENKIEFDEIADNHIYLLGLGDFFHYKYANDQFWYHNSKLIGLMHAFYDNLVELLIYCENNEIGNNGCLIECAFYTYLSKNNVIMQKSNVRGIFVREFIK
jgi:hypothetical protein